MEVGQTVSDRDARAFLLGAGAERPALDGQLLLGERVAGWLLAPPEAGLDRADRIVWTARRAYADADDVLGSIRFPIHAFFAAGAELVYVGRAHLASYRYGPDGEAALHLEPRLTKALWLRLGGSDGFRVVSGAWSADGLDAREAEREVARRVAAGLDLWIDSYEGPTLTVLANERRAFVMLLRYYGDAGMHAGDPAAEGDEEPEPFTLANGQVDEFPREWTVTHAQAMASVRAFLETRTLGSGVRRIQS